ncbi:MAG: hypothetical protein B6U88_01810 [Candidatus Aenigmarchaeota archaeon ex4484_56]|nr:MAG: hypothetical protein B6U88_01810 [Candidatus Aenigmarchaeota archaeon ex4484_56]
MKGQIFILISVSVLISVFFLLSEIHSTLYLPPVSDYSLQNIAKEYNYLLAYSVEDSYYEIKSNCINFCKFIKNNYPDIELFCLWTRGTNTGIANFFDTNLSFYFNGNKFELGQNDSVDLSGTNINFSSVVNFTYSPKSEVSGVIYLINNQKIKLLKIYK